MRLKCKRPAVDGWMDGMGWMNGWMDDNEMVSYVFMYGLSGSH